MNSSINNATEMGEGLKGQSIKYKIPESSEHDLLTKKKNTTRPFYTSSI